MINVVLVRGQRYNYKGIVYHRGRPKSVSAELSKELLALVDHRDIPHFKKASEATAVPKAKKTAEGVGDDEESTAV